jgi:hypothetical protein
MGQQYRALDAARRALCLNAWLQFLWRVKCDKAVERCNFDGVMFVHVAAL